MDPNAKIALVKLTKKKCDQTFPRFLFPTRFITKGKSALSTAVISRKNNPRKCLSY